MKILGGYIFLGSITDDPSSPSNGMIWYNSTLNKFRKRENGVTSDLDTTGGGVSNAKIIALSN